MTKKEVNIEALGPWCLALRHLHPYFEGEKMDSQDITVFTRNQYVLSKQSRRQLLSTTPFEVLPRYVIMSALGSVFSPKLTI